MPPIHKKNYMPNKDPNIWSYLLLFWRDLMIAITSSKVWLGVILSMTMTYFRNLYDDEHKGNKKLIAETILCGGITLTVSSILEACGLPEEIYICIGGGVGLLGVDFVRAKMRRYISRRIEDRRRPDDDF